MLLFFRSFFICPLEAAPLPPPPRLFPCQEWPQWIDVPISDYFSIFGLSSVLLLMGWDREIFACTRRHMLVGETDSFFCRKKSLHHPRTEDTGSCVYRQCSLWKLLTSHRKKFSFQTFLKVADSEKHNAWYGRKQVERTSLLKSIKHSCYITKLTCIMYTSSCCTHANTRTHMLLFLKCVKCAAK